MSVHDALHRARTVHHGEIVACTLCIVIQHTPVDHERVELEEAAAGKISGRALHRVLRKNGFGVSREVIDRHRNEGHKP